MSDDVDQEQVIKEFFEQERKRKLLLEQEQEVKKFWEEYGDEYFTGEDNG
jgi:hypothetical protein